MATKKKRGGGQPGLRPGHVVHVRAALRKLVKEHGGPAEVARLLGVSSAAISQITSEKNSPSMETAYRIADLRGVHVVDVLEGSV